MAEILATTPNAGVATGEVVMPITPVTTQELAAVEVDTPTGPVEVVFSIRDGILDDLSRVSDSLASHDWLPVTYYAQALGAGLAAAYIGVKAFKYLGLRGPIYSTLGAVVGGVLLDAVGKRMLIDRVERMTNGTQIT